MLRVSSSVVYTGCLLVLVESRSEKKTQMRLHMERPTRPRCTRLTARAANTRPTDARAHAHDARERVQTRSSQCQRRYTRLHDVPHAHTRKWRSTGFSECTATQAATTTTYHASPSAARRRGSRRATPPRMHLTRRAYDTRKGDSTAPSIDLQKIARADAARRCSWANPAKSAFLGILVATKAKRAVQVPPMRHP